MIAPRIEHWADVGGRWFVSCCPAFDKGSADPHVVSHGTEQEAIRDLVAHLADEHAVMVVRQLVIHDMSPCHGPPGFGVCMAEFEDDEIDCPCGGTSVVAKARTVTVDFHTMEAQP